MIAGMCSYIQSRFSESLEEYSKDPESTFSQAGVGMSLARLGRRNEALKAIETLKAASSKTYVSPGTSGSFTKLSEMKTLSLRGSKRVTMIRQSGCFGFRSIHFLTASAMICGSARW